MKTYTNLFFLLFIIIFLNNGCISQKRNLQSEGNVRLADSIIIKNLNHINPLPDSTRFNFQKALDYLDNAIELDSTNVAAYQSRITVLSELQMTNEIISTLKKRLSFDSSFAEGYMMLGKYYEINEKADSSLIVFSRAKEILLNRPSSDFRNSNIIYIEYLISKNKSEALNKLQEYPIKDSTLLRDIKAEIAEVENEK